VDIISAGLNLNRFCLRDICNKGIDFSHPAVPDSQAYKNGGRKITDIDRPKGIFTDYRHVGDFIRRIWNFGKFVILSVGQNLQYVTDNRLSKFILNESRVLEAGHEC
jgi:hypothetical protein